MPRFDRETFEIDSELTRDALIAGVWSRVCSEIADTEADAMWRISVEPLAVTRGRDASDVIARLASTEIDYLSDARRKHLAIEGAELGAKVEVGDIWRFTPKAWDETSNRWLWAPEIEPAESEGHRVLTVRQFGEDEQLRGA